MAVVVEVADQGHVAAEGVQLAADAGNLRGGFRRIDRDADQFRTRAPEIEHLPCGRIGVRGVGVGHGLDRNRRAAADRNPADHHLPGEPAGHAHGGGYPVTRA